MRLDASLRRRTLTAFLLGPAVIAAVLLLPLQALAIFLGVIALVSAWEWAALAGYRDAAYRIGFASIVLLGMLGLWVWPESRWWLIAVGVLWWGGQTLHLVRLSRIHVNKGGDLMLLPTGLLVLLAPWASLVEIRGIDPHGALLVLFLMLLIWTADSLAYFVGRRWGRAKLAPLLSPGKTRVGVYGALVGGLLWGVLLGWGLSLGPAGTLLAALLCAVTVSLSVVGDLYESLMKRRRGVKDSSHLLPGHGGLLDRVDSLTAAAPVFAAGLLLIGAVQ